MAIFNGMQIVSKTNSEILIAIPETSFKTKFLTLMVGMIFGGAFAFPAIAMIWDNASRMGVIELTCDRIQSQQVDCKIMQSQFLGLIKAPTQEYKLVKSAKQNVAKFQDGDGDTIEIYSLSIITNKGEVRPFSQTTQSRSIQLANAINNFIESSQKTLIYTIDEANSQMDLHNAPKYIFLLFPLPFLFVGGVIIWSSIMALFAYEELRLDKTFREIKYFQKSMFGKQNKVYKFTDIVTIDAKYSTDSYDNIYFTPRIKILTGEEFQLKHLRDRTLAISIVNNLREFAGLQQEEDPVVKA